MDRQGGNRGAQSKAEAEAALAEFTGSGTPLGATGSMRVTHKDLVTVPWQGQRTKGGCASDMSEQPRGEGCLLDSHL